MAALESKASHFSEEERNFLTMVDNSLKATGTRDQRYLMARHLELNINEEVRNVDSKKAVYFRDCPIAASELLVKYALAKALRAKDNDLRTYIAVEGVANETPIKEYVVGLARPVAPLVRNLAAMREEFPNVYKAVKEVSIRVRRPNSNREGLDLSTHSGGCNKSPLFVLSYANVIGSSIIQAVENRAATEEKQTVEKDPFEAINKTYKTYKSLQAEKPKLAKAVAGAVARNFINLSLDNQQEFRNQHPEMEQDNVLNEKIESVQSKIRQ